MLCYALLCCAVHVTCRMGFVKVVYIGAHLVPVISFEVHDLDPLGLAVERAQPSMEHSAAGIYVPALLGKRACCSTLCVAAATYCGCCGQACEFGDLHGWDLHGWERRQLADKYHVMYVPI